MTARLSRERAASLAKLAQRRRAQIGPLVAKSGSGRVVCIPEGERASDGAKEGA